MIRMWNNVITSWEREFDKKWDEGTKTGGFKKFIKEGFGFRTEMDEDSKEAIISFLHSFAFAIIQSVMEEIERMKITMPHEAMTYKTWVSAKMNLIDIDDLRTRLTEITKTLNLKENI